MEGGHPRLASWLQRNKASGGPAAVRLPGQLPAHSPPAILTLIGLQTSALPLLLRSPGGAAAILSPLQHEEALLRARFSRKLHPTNWEHSGVWVRVCCLFCCQSVAMSWLLLPQQGSLFMNVPRGQGLSERDGPRGCPAASPGCCCRSHPALAEQDTAHSEIRGLIAFSGKKGPFPSPHLHGKEQTRSSHQCPGQALTQGFPWLQPLHTQVWLGTTGR